MFLPSFGNFCSGTAFHRRRESGIYEALFISNGSSSRSFYERAIYRNSSALGEFFTALSSSIPELAFYNRWSRASGRKDSLTEHFRHEPASFIMVHQITVKLLVTVKLIKMNFLARLQQNFARCKEALLDYWRQYFPPSTTASYRYERFSK